MNSRYFDKMMIENADIKLQILKKIMSFHIKMIHIINLKNLFGEKN